MGSKNAHQTLDRDLGDPLRENLRGLFLIELAYKRHYETVFTAYGWKFDLGEEEILEKLLSLNLERGK